MLTLTLTGLAIVAAAAAIARYATSPRYLRIGGALFAGSFGLMLPLLSLPPAVLARTGTGDFLPTLLLGLAGVLAVVGGPIHLVIVRLLPERDTFGPQLHAWLDTLSEDRLAAWCYRQNALDQRRRYFRPRLAPAPARESADTVA